MLNYVVHLPGYLVIECYFELTFPYSDENCRCGVVGVIAFQTAYDFLPPDNGLLKNDHRLSVGPENLHRSSDPIDSGSLSPVTFCRNMNACELPIQPIIHK